MNPTRLVNAISLSRIPIALAFVFLFQRNSLLFNISVALIGLAVATDLADGYFARRLGIASVHGRLWDSLGDKAIYSAIVIAFNTQGLLNPMLGWGLIVREIALYVTRILYIEKLPMVERIRPFTNWHGYSMHAVILLGFCSMYSSIHGLSANVYLYTQIAGALALAFGIGSIVHWLKL